MQKRTDLDGFFNPTSVAILGRVPPGDPEKVMEGFRARYGCPIHLVNPKGGSLGSYPVYKTVNEIPDEVSLAVVNIGTNYVAQAMEELGAKGIKYALVYTAGFSETGSEGARLEQEFFEVAKKHGIRVFGPNTNTNAFERMPEIPNLRGGKIGLLTQSGHQGRPVVQGSLFGIGFSRWVPTGNEVDLEVADFLEYFAYDDETAVIAGYFEGFKDPDKLRRALRAANEQGKPVVALKIGATSAGQRMASSHTGHLTGADDVADGLFAQHGVTRVKDLDELLETASLFAKLPKGAGARVCCYSISGGSGTLMAEVAESFGVEIPALTDETQKQLHEHLPDYLTVANPVDNGGQFLVVSPKESRMRVLELIADDPNFDIIVIGITGALGLMTNNFAEDIKDFVDRSPKPVVVTWNSFKTDEPGFNDLVATGVPMFRSFRNCFLAVRAWQDYNERAKSFRERKPLDGTLSSESAAALGNGGTLDADATRALLEEFGVPVVRERVVTSADEAAKTAEEFRLPVVMKIASADFPHKSDLGLVVLDVDTIEDARTTYETLIERARKVDANARVDGVLVQEQVTGGVEMIVGALHDAVFGPAVMVGTGGVFAEILKDTAVRPLPLDEQDVREMVESLQGYALLKGARGRPAADIDSFMQCVLSIARLVTAAGDKVKELDVNPVVVRSDGAVAVDALVVA